MPPYWLLPGLLGGLSSVAVKTLTDLQRGFNALRESDVLYKPFRNQLAKRQFPMYLRQVCEALMERFTDKVLRAAPDSPFTFRSTSELSEFLTVVI